MALGSKRKGIIFIFEGVSGSGKGSVLEGVIQGDNNFNFSISATTRDVRPNEVDGVHYHFISDAAFENLKKDDMFYEFVDNNYGGKKYGTLKSEVDKFLDAGKDVILDIEYMGVCQVRERAENVVVIGIVPPSASILKDRLIKRGDSMEVIEDRMKLFSTRIKHQLEYEYVLINDNLEDTIKEAKKIVEVERMRASRQAWLKGMIEEIAEDFAKGI